MSTNEQRDTGIPTRAIHEAYLSMQQTHREYRRAVEAEDEDGSREKHARGEFQDAVLTFFELVRPHLKHESVVREYWQVELPNYRDWDFDSIQAAKQYIRQYSPGVYQVQRHSYVEEIAQETITDGGLNTYREWHDFLDLSWRSERLYLTEPEDDASTFVVVVLRIASVSLQELDDWQPVKQKQLVRGQGFMAGELSEDIQLTYQPATRIRIAKRLLVEAADKLGLLSRVDASETAEASGEYADVLNADVTVQELDDR